MYSNYLEEINQPTYLPKVGYPKYLEIQSPWGKVMERSGLRFENFLIKGVKLQNKKVCFWANFALMSRIFWYWCFSLGLTVSDLKTFTHKGCKIAAAKKVIYGFFFFICSLCLNLFLPKFPKSKVQTF